MSQKAHVESNFSWRAQKKKKKKKKKKSLRMGVIFIKKSSNLRTEELRGRHLGIWTLNNRDSLKRNSTWRNDEKIRINKKQSNERWTDTQAQAAYSVYKNIIISFESRNSKFDHYKLSWHFRTFLAISYFTVSGISYILIPLFCTMFA